MEVDILYAGGKQFEAVARDHVITIDQPFDDFGGDRGMTPPELFLSSLGSCAAYYVVEYLNARRLPSEGTRVRVRGVKGGKPTRIVSLALDIEVPRLTLDDRTRRGLEAAAQLCLVHQTLQNPPHVDVCVGCPETEAVGVA